MGEIEKLPDHLQGEITAEEWKRLPPRSRLLLEAGFVDPADVMPAWRQGWTREAEEKGGPHALSEKDPETNANHDAKTGSADNRDGIRNQAGQEPGA